MTRGDRALGIILGLIAGIAIVAIFVFVFSEDTIDSSQVEGTSGQSEEQREPGR